MDDNLKNRQKKYGDAEKSARLKQLILELGVKQTVFAEKMGVSRTTVTQMLNADRDIGENIAFKIERNFPNVNADWLMSGAGEMMKPMAVYEKETRASGVSEPEPKYEKGGGLSAAEVARMVEEHTKERARLLAIIEKLVTK